AVAGHGGSGPRVGPPDASPGGARARRFAGAFAAARKGRADGLAILAGPGIAEHPARLVDLAAQSRLPTIYLNRVFVEAGGLMSYAASHHDLGRRAAYYVDRLLKGA